MAEQTILEVLCGNHGSMDYERLLDISYGLTGIPAEDSLEQILRESDVLTVIRHDQRTEVFAQTRLKLCRNADCDELCGNLHMCKYELMMGRCSRHGCGFGHQLMSEHNMRILRAHRLMLLTRDDLCVLLLQSDNSLLPPVCVAYNRGQGPYGNCAGGETCGRLHVCEDFIRGCCDVTDCGRSHDFHEPHLRKVLRFRGVSYPLMCSLPFIYRNIHTLRIHASRRSADARPRRASETHAENEICLSFVRGFCRDNECCQTHSKMPYEWQVKVGRMWHKLPNSEQIERDYCDPSNIHSSGNEPVCFEEMTLGLDEVQRLSTQSSVLLPGFILTTSWNWYWRDEYGRWIQYASTTEKHRVSSVGSEQLEQEYQQCLQHKQEDAGVQFRAGNRCYELRFRDMKQRNEVSGTERAVRRRPVFVSSMDVQNARTRCCATGKPHFSKGVPGFWDQTAIPDSGFERVRLPPAHRDYVRVQERFAQTLSGFAIRQIERVQNRELWEDFMTKKEQMKTTNKYEKHGERLLFHASKRSLVDGVCHRNFGLEEFDAGAYGKGIYFSKEARYWSERADGSALGLMFACRVLVGYYTTGAARFYHPPAKNAEGHLYDSCVDDLRNPSVFVMFDKSQIYPEFLITYEESEGCEDRPGICTHHAPVSVQETDQSPNDTEPGLTLVITNSTSGTSALFRERSTPTAGPASVSSLRGPHCVPEHMTSSSRGANPLVTLSSSTVDTALPVSHKCVYTAVPVTTNSFSTALPVSNECINTALPVAAECSELPVAAEGISTTLPISAESVSTALPVSSKKISNAVPVTTNSFSTALPATTVKTFTALPVSAKSFSTALPVSVFPRRPHGSVLTAGKGFGSLSVSGVAMNAQAAAVKYSVEAEELNMKSGPVEENRTAQSSSRSSGSVSISSAVCPNPPHNHKGDSSGDTGTNAHKPAAQKKSCVVM